MAVGIGVWHELLFQKRSQLVICVHDEALTISAMCVGNEDHSPFTIHGCNTASGPACFFEIVSDDLPVPFHAADCACFGSPHGNDKNLLKQTSKREILSLMAFYSHHVAFPAKNELP